jgi:hypothetical protein
MRFRPLAVLMTMAVIAVIPTVPSAAAAAPTPPTPVRASEADADGPARVISAAQRADLLRAAANPGCGSRCDRKNPETYYWKTGPGGPAGPNWRTCADTAVTVGSARMGTSYWIDLRYSTECRTAWIRGNATHPDPNYGVSGSIHSVKKNGETRLTQSLPRVSSDRTSWSPMVNDAGLEAYGEIGYAGRSVYTELY